MLLALLLSAQVATVIDPAAPDRRAHCLDLATGDPVAGEREAKAWAVAGGGHLAQQCLGIAYANQARWPEAAAAFEQAARGAVTAKDTRAADFWAQAGNGWLAAGEPGKARAALDAAIAPGHLLGLALGEAHLDRARALVALGDQVAARADLDRATVDAADDPLAWLLSATLARRMGDAPRAAKDIAEALARAADDASVQLEAGNVAALQGNADAARKAWERAAELAPAGPVGDAARAALAQFAGDE